MFYLNFLFSIIFTFLIFSSTNGFQFEAGVTYENDFNPCGGDGNYGPRKYCQFFPCDWSNESMDLSYGYTIFECLNVPVKSSYGGTGFQLNYSIDAFSDHADADDQYYIPEYTISLWNSTQFNDQTGLDDFYSTDPSVRQITPGLKCMNSVLIGDGCYDASQSPEKNYIQNYLYILDLIDETYLEETMNFRIYIKKERSIEDTSCLSLNSVDISINQI